jgi:hypothetical protein
MKKSIVVGGFNKDQREKNLEKIKEKYSKKEYRFLEYIDNGTLKSLAIFEVNENILKKEKQNKLYIYAGFFLLLSIYLYIKGN